MIALPIISIVCCFAYIIFILFRYGVPVSISETYYLLPNKWDFLFAAWTVLTAIPLGIYWFTIAPYNLKWIPVTTMIAVTMIGVACCYKSGHKKEQCYTPNIVAGSDKKVKTKSASSSSFKNLLKHLFDEFRPKEFFKYGVSKLIHYVNSLIAIALSTTYICLTAGTQAIVSVILTYVMFILIGIKVDGVYNKDYSLDVDNSAWIFFMEVICFINIFIFIW